jgi:hypothetical protein
MAVNLFMVMVSTVTGAFLVEAGQRMGATGRLTARRMFVSNFCSLIQGPLSGLLATAGFMWATEANALFALTIFPIAYFFLKEQRVAQQGSSAVLQNAGQQLKTIIRSKDLWTALLFIALYYFSPGFSTPLFYKQTDELHFSKQFETMVFRESANGTHGVKIKYDTLRSSTVADALANGAAPKVAVRMASSRCVCGLPE